MVRSVNTYIFEGPAHLVRLTPVTKVTNMNGTSDVGCVDEGYVVAKIRRRLQKKKLFSLMFMQSKIYCK